MLMPCRVKARLVMLFTQVPGVLEGDRAAMMQIPPEGRCPCFSYKSWSTWG